MMIHCVCLYFSKDIHDSEMPKHELLPSALYIGKVHEKFCILQSVIDALPVDTN